MSRPVLSRFDRVFFRNTSQSDKAQTPWAGVGVSFYFQGATVSEEEELVHDATTSVAVCDPGALLEGDVVRVGLSGPTFTVSAVPGLSTVPGPTSIELHNDGVTFTLSVGDRLMICTSRDFI